MAVQLSPGVNITEIDLTTVVPSVASSDGAIAGLFRWGPIYQRVQVDSESKLVNLFGKPTNYNAETFFTAANFLSYSNSLYVSRAANTSGATPVVSGNVTATAANVYVSNTAGLSTGMYVTQITNEAAFVPAVSTVITAIVNTTCFTMSNTSGVTNGAVSIYFGHPETSYTALAFDPVTATPYTANLSNQIVTNSTTYLTVNGNFDTGVSYVARYPGAIGNSLRISVCDSVNAFSSNVTYANGYANSSVGTGAVAGAAGSYQYGVVSFNIGSNTASVVFSGQSNGFANADQYSVGDQILAGNAAIGFQYLQIANTLSVTANVAANTTTLTMQFQAPYRLATAYSTSTVSRYWEFHNVVNVAPGTSDYVINNGNSAAIDELHVVVVDDNGLFTGTPGTILETFANISRATDSKTDDNSVNYYKEVINQNSNYIWWANDRSGSPSANAALVSSSTDSNPSNMQLVLGSDGLDETNANNLAIIANAYNLFQSAEDVDISLVLQGRPLGPSGQTYQLANYIIDNIVTLRADCIALISPDKSLEIGQYGLEAANLVGWRNNLHSTSYAVMDSGYKYQYDRYNDIYRWIPLNGDVAGLCARTDQTNDAWWSPAGFNRGQIKNIVKLAYNPKHTDRDTLYKNGINPVVAFPGQGIVLYGDKTLQAKPSAFDRINVRRLFLVLEKAISIAAKYSLFEFNDAFTRSQFKNLVTPYLRTIQGRRGITDFLVVCDDTNNTPNIVDSNQFVGDIYIKPARSINFIQLNFVAVATGVQFSEVVGQF